MVLEQLLHQDKQPERKKKKRAHPRCSKLTPPRVYKRKQEKLHPRTSTHTSQATVTPEAQRNSNRIWIRVYKLPAIVTPVKWEEKQVLPAAPRRSSYWYEKTQGVTDRQMGTHATPACIRRCRRSGGETAVDGRFWLSRTLEHYCTETL